MPNKLEDEILKKLEANYNIKNIREDLISQGFSSKEVEKAIEETLKTFGKSIKEREKFKKL